ncbi:hypothetical protein GGTG_00853 [Gaeumannomyces tritici R3-111a-1]|uniref:BSD domain-containing protein n=1 Tax=Gaeumannomyces tritici (strain R3-111a-1) TaxID=644352 RepID=J3NHW7_GAET3|nr:hypothetical protein GGTG_00853 [Gaeumannomyces tritici R3-111a-1]EJT80860.1 hypothetical protein GGTG_00853 [Gaeumannomyces tritici R3-111a-1]
MDLAYDQILEKSVSKENETTPWASGEKKPEDEEPTLSAEVQDAYRAFSSSPWGARIGGFIGTVAKQGGNVYREAQHVGQDATTGFSSLRDAVISRTRGLSLVGGAEAPPTEGSSSAAAGSKGTDTTAEAGTRELTTDEALKESENVLSRLKVAAAQRLKDIQKAEDAADEALLKFGTNIRDFLRESISIAGPGGEAASGSARGGASADGVLFESKDAQGKRVIHTSRFDAQLHVIHTNPESFSKDPASEEYAAWSSSFDIDKKTTDIAADLTKYPELRTTMEKLVPDQIPYPDFWKRYYFLRHSIETAEARRRDLLKAASAEEEVGWDEDSEDDDEEDSSEDDSDDETTTSAAPSKPAATETKSAASGSAVPAAATQERPGSTDSSTTIQSPSQPTKPAVRSSLKTPTEHRKSNELDVKSQADSEASYDVVGATSGVPSQAPNSPNDKKGEDSDEEDWE